LEAAPIRPSNSPIYLEGNAFINYFAAFNIFRLLFSVFKFPALPLPRPLAGKGKGTLAAGKGREDKYLHKGREGKGKG
jgi:hypothetical protein